MAIFLVFLVLLAVALGIAGCSTSRLPTSPPIPAGLTFSHIHALVIDPTDNALLVATHKGLYRLTIDSAGSAATAVGPIGGLDLDLMGFTIAAGTAYASGHPGPATPNTFGSPNLGIISSTDMGGTWTNVALTDVTDFHSLTVAPSGAGPVHVFGYDAAKGRIERSLDGGVTWSEGAELRARDILAIGDQLYATTADGLAVSSDEGMTFTVAAAAPKLYILATDLAGTIAGIDATGTLWTRAQDRDWVHGRTVTGAPQAFAFEGDRIYIADDRGIAITDDAGATWTVLELRK